MARRWLLVPFSILAALSFAVAVPGGGVSASRPSPPLRVAQSATVTASPPGPSCVSLLDELAPAPDAPVGLDPGGFVLPGATDLQTTLSTAGYDPGPVDGAFGPKSLTAEQAWLAHLTAGWPSCVWPVDLGPLDAFTAYAATVPDLVAQAQARVVVYSSSSRAPSSACGSDFACFKACTLNIESGGNYAAISSGGTYRGAWQFDQRTWDSNAAASGHPELVGQDPATVSEGGQDAVAQSTYDSRGNQPWGGRC